MFYSNEWLMVRGRRSFRPAFTLVELLVVMMIMGVLASIVLFALASVQESARYDKTIATINKLNALIMSKYESYRTRRIPVDVVAVARAKSYVGNTATSVSPMIAAQVRLDVIRDLMRLELPDSFGDIYDDPTTKSRDLNGNTTPMSRPAVSAAYNRLIPTSGSTSGDISAKCLYLIVTHGLDDPDVLEQFSPSEIGPPPEKTGGDGLHYFVDGWGNPIKFLRWAPGFRSPLQNWEIKTNPKTYPTVHDPFDPLKAYKPASSTDLFYNSAVSAQDQIYPALYPLIYSSGGDSGDATEIEAAPGINYSSINNDPYYSASHPKYPMCGAWTDTNNDTIDDRSHDITNQDGAK